MQTLDFTELETLVHIMRLKSFSGTAERMHTTQSNISKRMNKMETALGVKLLRRAGRKTRMTPEGETMVDYAKKLLALREEMMAAVTAPAVKKGVFRIGSSESIVMLLLPDILNAFNDRYPLIRFDLQVDTSQNLKKKLLRDEIDLAFLIGGTGDPYFTDMPLVNYELGWFINKTLKVPDDFEELLGLYPIITFSTDTAPCVNLIKTLRRKHVKGYRIHNCASLSTLVNLTVGKTGVGIFPKKISTKPPWSGQMKELNGFDLDALNYFVSYNDADYRPIIRSLADISQTIAQRTPNQ